MARQERPYYAFNRGIVSALGLSRVDRPELSLAAETMTNWMPRVLGSMMLRPGLKYVTASKSVGSLSQQSVLLPFVFAVDDTALIEISGNGFAGDSSAIRFIIDDTVLTRPTVTATITNGSFSTNLNDWNDRDESGATSAHGTFGLVGEMQLTGTGENKAIRTQEVTVTETGTEHGIAFNVRVGKVTVRMGSSEYAEDYFEETELGPGIHNLAITPSGNFWIEVSSREKYTSALVSVAVTTGAVTGDFPTDLNAGKIVAADYPTIRYYQSGDVLFVTVDGVQPLVIKRLGARSWSWGYYESQTGPYRPINTTDITMYPDALEGDVTITASNDFFRSGHIGSLLRIESLGQTVQESAGAQNTFTDPIRVDGTGDGRIFNLVITGTWTATVTLQRSVGAPGAWTDINTYTTNQDTTVDDGLDNQVIYYRLGVKTGDYTSGTAAMELSISSGSITGVAKITALNSATSVDAIVLSPFGSFGADTASKFWWEGAWSDFRGWPSAVSIYEGRLWFAGLDRIYGSVSDDYYSFDDLVEGSSGAIVRSIGFGPVQTIHWLMSLGRLAMGTAQNSANVGAAIIDGNNSIVARSSSEDEPLTPTNFNLKNTDASGLFVDRSKARLYMLAYQGGDYVPVDLSVATPDLNAIGINYIAVQMKPDMRVHCVRADGKVSVLVFARDEEVAGWVEVETDGIIEHCCVLPGTVEDEVYYVVKRTIDGADEYYHEKWALESECVGGTLNKQADSFIEYSGASTTSITGLDHLEGESVVVWGNGAEQGPFTVSGGAITLTTAVTSAIIGLPYTAQWKSAKLANASSSSLNQYKKIERLGVIAQNVHHLGLQYGPDFNNLSDLPQMVDGAVVAEDTVHAELDQQRFPFGGSWNTDSRLCLQATAPKPCTLLSCVIETDITR